MIPFLVVVVIALLAVCGHMALRIRSLRSTCERLQEFLDLSRGALERIHNERAIGELHLKWDDYVSKAERGFAWERLRAIAGAETVRSRLRALDRYSTTLVWSCELRSFICLALDEIRASDPAWENIAAVHQHLNWYIRTELQHQEIDEWFIGTVSLIASERRIERALLAA